MLWGMNELTPQQALERVQAGALLVDVRENEEYADVHARGAQLMPLSTFQQTYTELPQDAEIVLICRSGARSGRATEFLMSQGYTNVSNLAGGTMAWVDAGLPTGDAQ